MQTNYVFVLDTDRVPQAPVHPAHARTLLRQGDAAVFRKFPFTIILKGGVEGQHPISELHLKIDPGSKTTGFALLNGHCVIWAAELTHRGQQIKAKLESRRSYRRGRRQRKTRYRQPRFLNRRRPGGWLPPSLQHRVDTILTWVERLSRYCPIIKLSQELVRFDTQALEHPEISGVAYQQGELLGYEIREYLLEKWGRRCAYCTVTDVPLAVEHIVPKARRGSNRVSNLTLACRPCNQAKGKQTAAEFGHPDIAAAAQRPLKDAAAINTTRWALYNQLQATGLELDVGTGGCTKFNRARQRLSKTHWLDAACVGRGTPLLHLLTEQPLRISATGHHSRLMCRMNRYGFPRTRAKGPSEVHGFRTGDIVCAEVPSSKHAGRHRGRVAVRSTGSFNIKNDTGTIQGIFWKYCRIIHRRDGYSYVF